MSDFLPCYLIPMVTIMLLYEILWAVKYPREHWEILMFRDHWFVAVGTWFFLIGAVVGLCYWVEKGASL